jgi:hypothetical protein
MTEFLGISAVGQRLQRADVTGLQARLMEDLWYIASLRASSSASEDRLSLARLRAIAAIREILDVMLEEAERIAKLPPGEL